ncbi:helix-turn-helix transcriptional regulator [Marinomonas transparens]|uniref:Response regulator transcription factor n=1 Tax=Marinomonas transparens TaxID=2795388 RepID=A0A934N0D8_9GAMM|nr:response regulator transcription factor [Marinomonas transparens]MBJ7538465.1 response regulator transcription factor [Marinomonas transparens]
MRILCWNTDETVWRHWNRIVGSEVVLVRVTQWSQMLEALQSEDGSFRYCFIYLDNENFSERVELVVSLRASHPQQKMIVFPNQASQQAALRLFSVGVSGQCAPYIGEEQLKLVLSVVESGEIWGGKAFIQQLIMQSAFAMNSGDAELDGLSDREQDVARRIGKGLSNKQIANDMDITERTVKAHLTAIFKKTNTKDRLSLALMVQKSHAMH